MDAPFPRLPYPEWKDTLATVHRWLQVIGKVKLALTPTTNHFWNTALHLTPRGLTTGTMPFGWNTLEMEVDFTSHVLGVRTSDDEELSLELRPMPVADFYNEVLEALSGLGLELSLNEKPQELLSEVLPLDQDRLHFTYDKEAMHRCWRAMSSAAIALEEFRARFSGKSSPVNFFWGSFDLAVTRFSGERAPPRPGADFVTREAYRDECASVGFWPGDEIVSMPAFYSYFAPSPAGLESSPIRPDAASWEPRRGEFILPYDAVRLSPTPRTMLLDFFQSTYEAGARLAGWDPELERVVPDRRAGFVRRIERERPEDVGLRVF